MTKYIFKYSLLISLVATTIWLSSCKDNDTTPLPILGRPTIVNGDTIPHTIPSFNFTNQNKEAITNKDLQPYLYISDFFFMSCPTICPKVKKQMLRIYKKYESNPQIKLVSHTLDPKRDTPERLKMYAENLDVDHQKWYFLHGDKNDIFDIADDYFVAAFEDPDAPGGLDHSGKIILVDKSGHVRGFAEGTEPDEVTDFFSDIDKLLKEYAQ